MNAPAPSVGVRELRNPCVWTQSTGVAILFAALLAGGCQTQGEQTTAARIPVLSPDVPITTIAFGSCNDEDKPQPLWPVIAAENPDLWIWTGDNIYADTEDPAEFRAKYDKQLANPAYVAFTQAVPMLTGTWDDHDYGLNDGGAEYSQKDLAKQEMYRFLGVPADDPSVSRPGTHRAYLYGPEGRRVKVLLLDTRWFRDPIERTTGPEATYIPNESGTMLGEAQWAWLEEELSRNEAQVHVIVSSIQLIASEHRFEKWANFPAEQQRFYRLLETTRPAMPIVVSGDRHAGEISVVELNGLGQPLYDITSSGLTNVWSRMFDERNSRALGPKVIEQNYGRIRIDWPEGVEAEESSPSVRLSLHTLDGEAQQVVIGSPLAGER